MSRTRRMVARTAASSLVPDTPGAEQFAECVRQWESKLDRVEIDLPAAARDYADTWKTATAHILINRDGPALQPGPRRYTRSWVRDGAIMAAALLRMGCVEEALEFVRWYAPYQAPDGAVPCCVDRSGPDWLVEHDSHGELVFAVWDCFRFTGDHAFLEEMWPAVAKAVAYIEGLRETRLTPEYETDETRAPWAPARVGQPRGLPRHPSTRTGLLLGAARAGDAAAMAMSSENRPRTRHLTELAHSFCESLYASLYRTIAERGTIISPAPSSGDFDPTRPRMRSRSSASSTTCRPAARAYVRTTWRGFESGGETRSTEQLHGLRVALVGALVHLGRRADRQRARGVPRRRPASACLESWPEISWRDPKSPGHIGTSAHVIGRSTCSRCAASRVRTRGGPGAGRRGGHSRRVAGRRRRSPPCGAPTPYGTLSFSLRSAGSSSLSASLSGDLEMPPGKSRRPPPLPPVHSSGRGPRRRDRDFDAEASRSANGRRTS